jgi:uncharacterized protein YjbJ (UPF0337 family)
LAGPTRITGQPGGRTHLAEDKDHHDEHQTDDRPQNQSRQGAIKQFLGRATGDTRLRNEGRLDRATGNAARTVDKLGDAFKP